MASRPNKPDDFVVQDDFHRTLRFYIQDGEYWRFDESANAMGSDAPNPRHVSKMVYAMLWLDLCLKEMV